MEEALMLNFFFPLGVPPISSNLCESSSEFFCFMVLQQQTTMITRPTKARATMEMATAWLNWRSSSFFLSSYSFYMLGSLSATATLGVV